MAECRFRRLETCEEEETCFVSATDMKANGQLVYMMIGGELDFQKLQRWNRAVSLNIMICTKFWVLLEVSLVQMDALSLNYWLTKFIQDVAKLSKERYPANGNVIPDWSTNQLTPFVSAKGLVKNQSFPSLIQYESINFNTRLDYINGNKTRIRVLWSISLLTKVQWEKWNEAHFFFLKIFQGNGNKKNRQKRVNFYFRNEFSGKKKYWRLKQFSRRLTKQPEVSWTIDLQRFSMHKRRLIYTPEIFAYSKIFMTPTFNFLNYHPISYLSASVTHNK